MPAAQHRFKLLVGTLVTVHIIAFVPGFFAPFDPAAQNRTHPFERPRLDGILKARLFVHGPEYKLFGVLNASTHLFGFGAEPVFLLGTDGLGRDQLSRLVYGARVSLAAGLAAAGISIFAGALLGGTAGYFGGWLESVTMRATELFLALPWIYLLIVVRAFLPLDVSPERAFFLIVLIIGVIGWARPGRMIRGVVLSAKERDYVAAARGFGASNWYLLRRHVLPAAYGAALAQFALLIPQFILAEVGLSFLGLGVAEPFPSWGNMLAALRQYHVMSHWWMYAPAMAMVPVLLLYHALSDRIGRISDDVLLTYNRVIP